MARVKSYILFAAVLLLFSCKETPQPTINSVYYWSTTWESDSMQQEFLRENHVSRLYLRYFDVVVDAEGAVMPNATLRFADALPQDMEVVPTVFIVNDCMVKDTKGLGMKILKRVRQMTETHDVPNVHELQIDCDWSRRTRAAYFAMLEELRDSAHAYGLQLSATIRLHQLSDAAPPVDRGVLMMYNTGDVSDLSHNPILEKEAVEPYLKHISNYSLDLATAYPVFSWQLLVRSGKFVGIMHSDDDLPVLPGDTILQREVGLEEVLTVKDAVTRQRSAANQEIILFDISKKNIQRIKDNHYEKIYRH